MARVRKTVPFFKDRPHREHRSKRGRSEDHHFKRDIRLEIKSKIAKLLNEEHKQELYDNRDLHIQQ